ncbi:MAG: hypothetical protein L0Z62_39365 [Gemmataceae bacterium]|nr:hypothetical protein [Gemmataceae bacterium]
MSTPAPADSVQQALLEKLQREVFPALQALVAALPLTLADAAQAERQIRAGVLAAARSLLAAWGQTADPHGGQARLPSRPPADAPQGLPGQHDAHHPRRRLFRAGALSLRGLRGRVLPPRRPVAVPGPRRQLAAG